MSEPITREFITVQEVTKRLNLSRATIWRLEKQGLFPLRRQITPGRVGWIADDISKWVADRPLTKAGKYREVGDE